MIPFDDELLSLVENSFHEGRFQQRVDGQGFPAPPRLVIDMHQEKGALAWGGEFADEFDFFR